MIMRTLKSLPMLLPQDSVSPPSSPIHLTVHEKISAKTWGLYFPVLVFMFQITLSLRVDVSRWRFVPYPWEIVSSFETLLKKPWSRNAAHSLVGMLPQGGLAQSSAWVIC